MKLVLKDGAFVLLPESQADASRLATLIGNPVELNYAHLTTGEHLTSEGRANGGSASGRQLMGATGQCVVNAR